MPAPGTPPFSSFGYMLRSAIAGSFDNSVFNFFKGAHVLKKKHCHSSIGLLQWLSGKESACNAGDLDLIPGSGNSSEGGHGNPLQ